MKKVVKASLQCQAINPIIFHTLKYLIYMTENYATYIGLPLLPDDFDHIVQLVQLLQRVVWFGVNRDQNQVFHHWNKTREHYTDKLQ